jgi:hypothetical protein
MTPTAILLSGSNVVGSIADYHLIQHRINYSAFFPYEYIQNYHLVSRGPLKVCTATGERV